MLRFKPTSSRSVRTDRRTPRIWANCYCTERINSKHFSIVSASFIHSFFFSCPPCEPARFAVPLPRETGPRHAPRDFRQGFVDTPSKQSLVSEDFHDFDFHRKTTTFSRMVVGILFEKFFFRCLANWITLWILFECNNWKWTRKFVFIAILTVGQRIFNPRNLISKEDSLFVGFFSGIFPIGRSLEFYFKSFASDLLNFISSVTINNSVNW